MWPATSIRVELSERLADVDSVLTLTVPYLAPTLTDVRDPSFDYDGLPRRFGFGRYTKIGNITGLPVVMILNAVTEGSGARLQLLESPFHEASLLGVAARLAPVIGPADGE